MVQISPAVPENEFRKGWKVIVAALVGWGTGVNVLGMSTLGVFVPYLASTYGWSLQQIMVGMMVQSVAMLLGGPIVGGLADRYGSRPVALASLVLFGLSFASFAFNDGHIGRYWASWFACAFLGGGTSYVLFNRAVNSWFDARKGLALGLSTMGQLFQPLQKALAAWLVSDYDVRVAYLVLALLPIVIGLPVCLWGLRERAIPKKAAGERPLLPGASLGGALRDWRFWVLSAALAVLIFAMGGPVPHLENLLKTKGFVLRDMVAVASAYSVAALLTRPLVGWLFDRFWAPAVVLAVTCVTISSGWILSRDEVSYGAGVLATAILGMSTAVILSMPAYLIPRYFGMRSFGAIFGVLFGLASTLGSTAPIFYGRIFDATGSYDSALLIVMLLPPLGGLMVLSLGRYRDHAATASRDAA